MTRTFSAKILANSVEIRLAGPKGPIAPGNWALVVPTNLIPAVDALQDLASSDEAMIEAEYARLSHRGAASLIPAQAIALGLPARSEVMAEIRMKGVLGKPGYAADLVWKRSSGTSVLVSERRGAFLKIGNGWQRLPPELYDVAERVDALNAASADIGAQLAAVADLRQVLPVAERLGASSTTGTLAKMTIAVADAMSLDLQGEDETCKLVPILHRAGAATDAPLLPPLQQAAFGEQQFHAFGADKDGMVRAYYAVGGDTYVVLSEPLRRALGVVKHYQNRSAALRQALFAQPRAHLRDALDGAIDDATLEGLVRETTAYSNRVIGLGLWTPRIVPWIKLPSTDWLGDGHEPGRPSSQVEAGISIGDLSLTLTRTEARDLADKLEAAIVAGNGVVPFVHQGTVHSVPAVPAALAAVRQVSEELDKRTVGISASSEAPAPAPEDFAGSEPEAPIVTLIRTNEGAVEFEGLVSPRQHSPFGTPSSIRSTLKPHQCEGLDWLQKAWSFGNPGVLLADDMGLGKTLQGLAFMAWLREGMASGKIPRRPILIVAPTGLLANWLKEHDLHLRAPGLGICLEAYGAGLKPLKRQDVSGRAGLDTSRLQSADWVLTTYETLRDYIADFAAVRFAALMFDEAQKIKNPGVRMTDAAKSAQADFIIALTGTPVENQLADLWCITDTVHPAVLGDLKSFSKTYEDASDTGQTAQLRASLDSWRGSRPPLMLRRMKRDKLPDLPEEREYLRPSAMPAPQLAAYSAAITEARGADEPEAMLKVLQALRRISLHPSVDMEGNDTAFIAASARLTKAFEALDQIARSGERALIFLEERAMQARLVGILQRRYTLPQPPMLITGEVAGSKRQERVDAFQSASDGFDVMILSPKAGGVGLTLTRANHVIHLSRWWNPAVEDQCTGRAMRIGQTRPVSIHIPQATLPDGRRSFDENLDALLARKRQLSRDALMPSERPAEDTQELFRATVG